MSKKQVIELEWFSVDEKLPDVSKSCLIKLDNNWVLFDCYYNKYWYSLEYSLHNYSGRKVIEWCYLPLFSYAQDISVDLDSSCEVDDDGSVILTEDKLTELVNEVDNVRVK
jgi:hypothetical protein